MKKQTKIKKEKVADTFTHEAEITILGKKYLAHGQSVNEALANLKVIGIPRTMSVLKIKNGDYEKSRVLVPRQTFRLFSPSLMMREIAIKQISMLF